MSWKYAEIDWDWVGHDPKEVSKQSTTNKQPTTNEKKKKNKKNNRNKTNKKKSNLPLTFERHSKTFSSTELTLMLGLPEPPNKKQKIRSEKALVSDTDSDIDFDTLPDVVEEAEKKKQQGETNEMAVHLPVKLSEEVQATSPVIAQAADITELNDWSGTLQEQIELLSSFHTYDYVIQNLNEKLRAAYDILKRVDTQFDSSTALIQRLANIQTSQKGEPGNTTYRHGWKQNITANDMQPPVGGWNVKDNVIMFLGLKCERVGFPVHFEVDSAANHVFCGCTGFNSRYQQRRKNNIGGCWHTALIVKRIERYGNNINYAVATGRLFDRHHCDAAGQTLPTDADSDIYPNVNGNGFYKTILKRQNHQDPMYFYRVPDES